MDYPQAGVIAQISGRTFTNYEHASNTRALRRNKTKLFSVSQRFAAINAACQEAEQCFAKKF